MTETVTSRLAKGGRAPTTRDSILAYVLDHPGEGLLSTTIADRMGLHRVGVCDALQVLRKHGFVEFLRLDRRLLHFAPGAYRDLYAEAYKDGMSQVRRDEATLAGIMDARRARVIELLGMGLPLGLTAMELGAELGVSSGVIRPLLGSMKIAGDVFPGGNPRAVRWFGTAAARDAATPALDELAARHKAEVAAVLKTGCKAAAAKRQTEQRPTPPKKPSVMTPWAKLLARDVVARQPRGPKPAPVPVVIVGLDTAPRTEAIKYADHRFSVPDTHRGEFASMRIGEYLES